MKFLIKYTFVLSFLAFNTFAIDSGSLDTSFSNDANSAGWDLTTITGGSKFATDTTIDTQGRVLVAGSLREQGATEYNPYVMRYLANGQLDTTFATNGLFKWPGFNTHIETVKVGFTKYDDKIFLAYSMVNNTSNNIDVAVISLDSTGLIIDLKIVDFDLGGTADRKDDILADMVVTTVPTNLQGSVILAMEIERSDSNDTDFGIVKLKYNPLGSFSYDTTFSTDGKSNCYFDQTTSGFGIDQPRSIKPTYHGGYVVAGSAFQGNGDDSNGWNLAFCEFSEFGNLVKKWSTINPNPQADSREFLADIAISSDVNSNGEYLIALSQEPETNFATDFDFAVRKYLYNGGNWDLDQSFGTNGVSRISFVDGYLFPSPTNDKPVAVLIEAKNSQILIAGNASWFDTNSDYNVHMAFAKLNANGNINSSWGANQTGKAYVSLENSLPQLFGDSMTYMAEDAKSEKIYISSYHTSTTNQISAGISRIHNDLIFKNGF